MEDTLRAIKFIQPSQEVTVLILVLMEDTLRVYHKNSAKRI